MSLKLEKFFMCFSASTSFTVSSVLFITGTYLVCKKKPRRFIPIALIPIFFAIQQFAEGIIWLNILKDPPNCIATFFKNVFLFFAYSFWPLWIPFSLWIAETENNKRQILTFFLGMGLVISSLLLPLIFYVNLAHYHKSIYYFLDLKGFGKETPLYNFINVMFLTFYTITTLMPLLFSSVKKIWCMAILILLSGAAFFLIDRFLFISMWCFFAAIISISLFFLLTNETK